MNQSHNKEDARSEKTNSVKECWGCHLDLSTRYHTRAGLRRNSRCLVPQHMAWMSHPKLQESVLIAVFLVVRKKLHNTSVQTILALMLRLKSAHNRQPHWVTSMYLQSAFSRPKKTFLFKERSLVWIYLRSWKPENTKSFAQFFLTWILKTLRWNVTFMHLWDNLLPSSARLAMMKWWARQTLPWVTTLPKRTASK